MNDLVYFSTECEIIHSVSGSALFKFKGKNFKILYYYNHVNNVINFQYQTEYDRDVLKPCIEEVEENIKQDCLAIIKQSQENSND